MGLWNLYLRLAQKVGIFASLSLGVFACIIEIVRIYFVFNVTEVDDMHWTNTDAMIWTAVETKIAVTCANIPAAAPLLKRARESQRGSRWFGPSRCSYTSKISSLKARFRRTERNIRETRIAITQQIHLLLNMNLVAQMTQQQLYESGENNANYKVGGPRPGCGIRCFELF